MECEDAINFDTDQKRRDWRQTQHDRRVELAIIRPLPAVAQRNNMRPWRADKNASLLLLFALHHVLEGRQVNFVNTDHRTGL